VQKDLPTFQYCEKKPVDRSTQAEVGDCSAFFKVRKSLTRLRYIPDCRISLTCLTLKAKNARGMHGSRTRWLRCDSSQKGLLLHVVAPSLGRDRRTSLSKRLMWTGIAASLTAWRFETSVGDLQIAGPGGTFGEAGGVKESPASCGTGRARRNGRGRDQPRL
jgi:hypothetical protein